MVKFVDNAFKKISTVSKYAALKHGFCVGFKRAECLSLFLDYIKSLLDEVLCIYKEIQT